MFIYIQNSCSPKIIDSSRHFLRFVSLSSFFHFTFIFMESCCIYLCLYVLPKKEIESQLTPKIIKNFPSAHAKHSHYFITFRTDGAVSVFFCWGKSQEKSRLEIRENLLLQTKNLSLFSYFCKRIFFSSETRPD